MADVDTSIYRPQSQQNPLDTITKFGGAADALGGLAVGDAVKQALDPNTGEINKNALAAILKQSTAGSMKAIPTLTALEQLKSAGFAADQAGLETFQKRMAITHHLFSGLASKDKPTMADVYDVATKALDPALNAKKYGITMPVIMNALKSFRGPDGKPLTAEQIKQKALEIQTQAASTSEILNQHSPRMGVVDRGPNLEIVPYGTGANPNIGGTVPKGLPPGTVVPSPSGARYLGEQPSDGPAYTPPPVAQPPADVTATSPYSQPAVPKDQGRIPPRGQVPGSVDAIQPNRVRAVPVTPQPTGPAAGLEPGYVEAASGIAGASAQSANRLTDAADGAMSRKAMLGNLENDLTQFTTGKGADWTRVAKNFAGRNLPVPDAWKKEGAILDEQSVASQEQFNKQAMMIAQSQFSTIGGTGTDAKFSSAFETSPNEALSQLGNKGIIRLLKGNEDAILAKNKAWQKWTEKNGPQTYAKFSADFNQNFDPRVFQFKYMPTKEERQAYIDKMDPNDRGRFLHDLTHARKEGWVSFDVPKK